MKKHSILAVILIIVGFAAGIVAGFLGTRPPAAPSESNPDHAAHAQMLENIETMTQQPHPSGSQELADVRAHLLSQLDAMGAEYRVLETVCSLDEIAAINAARGGGPDPGDKVMLPSGEVLSGEELARQHMRDEAVFDENDNVTLYNVLVKLDAPGTENGVLFMAHYDSEFDVPGACDDMAGVCALLEAVRRHADNGTLQNDLYFLFTDGEELSGMGAMAFVRDNPEFKDKLKLIVNLDSRGTRGGLLMFETSANDYEQAAWMKKALSRPTTYSWMPMIYRMMSNGTDLTHFIKEGYPALNFAVAEGAENYSSPNDNIDNLHRGTAYHFLQTAFELTDYAAAHPLANSGNKRDGVYFTLLPGVMILVSDVFAIALAAVAILGAAAAMLWLRRVRRLRLAPAIMVILLILLTAACAPLLNAASYLLSIPLLCLALALFCPVKWKAAACALLGLVLMLLYTPLCWLIAVALGLEAIPLIAAAAAVPLLAIAAFLASRPKALAQQA